MLPRRALLSAVRDISRTRVLVTGGGGFIGSHLCERLVGRGATVAILARTRGRLRGTPTERRCDFLEVDLHDHAAAVAAIGSFRPDVVVHLAAHPDGAESWEQARACVRTNIAGTLTALEGLRRGGGSLFVYGDSTKVYGNGPVPYTSAVPPAPTSSYAITKAAGWQLCAIEARVHGIAACAVRPTLIYGPGQGINLFSFVATSVRRGVEELRLDGGDQTRDPLYIDDAIDAYVAVLEAGERAHGRVINIGGGVERKVSELATIVVRLLGGSQRVVSVPAKARPTEIWRSVCDNSEAETLLGWRPRVALEQGLRITLGSLGYIAPATDVAVNG